MDNKEGVVGGLWANGGPQERAPEEVTLKEGEPIYHALLESEEGVVDSFEVTTARQRLEDIIATNPQAVLSCQGKSLEEAKAILEKVETDSEQKKAA